MKDILSAFLTAGVIQVFNLATGILAARLLLPDGRGELAALLLWPMIVAELGLLGVFSAAAFHGARARHAPAEIVAASAAIITVLTPVLMAIGAVIIPYVYADARPEIAATAPWMLAIIPVHLVGLTLLSLFQGRQAFTEYNLLRATHPIFYLALILVLVWIDGATVQGFAIAFVAANAMPTVFGLPVAAKRGWLRLRLRLAVVRDMLHYGLRAHVLYVLGYANRRLDQALISIALAASDLGLYVIALTLQGLPILVTSTMDNLAFPKIAAQSTENGAAAVLGRYLRATLILTVPFAVLLIAIAPWLIGLVFGASFVPAADVARLLVAAAVPYAFKVLLTTFLRASNRMRVASQAEAIAIVGTVAALAALLPTIGIMGAAVAQTLALTLSAAFIAWRLGAEYGVDVAGLLRFRRDDLEPIREAAARFRGGRAG